MAADGAAAAFDRLDELMAAGGKQESDPGTRLIVESSSPPVPVPWFVEYWQRRTTS